MQAKTQSGVAQLQGQDERNATQIQRSQLAEYIGRTRRIDTMADPNKRARLHKSG